MTNLKEQEELRDSIANVLELSRASWKLRGKRKKRNVRDDNPDDDDDFDSEDFPRSIVIKTLTRYPLASIATIAAVWYIGPARFSAMAVAGASLFIRHRLSILPLAEQLITSSLFRPRKSDPE